MDESFDTLRWPYAIDTSGRFAQEPSYPAHVEQLIRQVLFTAPGERAHRPDFGCGLPRMVFAPNSEATAQILQVMVVQSLDRWLGSVLRTDSVKVSARDEVLEVRIVYYLKAHGERRYLNLEVTP